MQKIGGLFSNYVAKDEVENSCDVAKSQSKILYSISISYELITTLEISATV